MARTRTQKGTTKIEMSGRPRHRSRSLKRVQRRTPSKRTVTHYKKKKPAKHKCAICSAVLHGKPRDVSSKIKNTLKSKRKVNRPFGGMLCTKCSRRVISLRARLKNGLIDLNDIPISLRKYIK